MINHGRIITSGTPHEVLTTELLREVFGVDARGGADGDLVGSRGRRGRGVVGVGRRHPPSTAVTPPHASILPHTTDTDAREEREDYCAARSSTSSRTRAASA